MSYLAFVWIVVPLHIMLDILQCLGNWLVNSSCSAGQSDPSTISASAIRGTVEESFNREQREGAVRSQRPFSWKGTLRPIWVSFVPKGILYLISSSLNGLYDKLQWFLIERIEKKEDKVLDVIPLTFWIFFFLCLESIFVLTRSWHTHKNSMCF